MPPPPPLSINHLLAADAMTLKRDDWESEKVNTSFDWSDLRLWLICEILIDISPAAGSQLLSGAESQSLDLGLLGDYLVIIMLPVWEKVDKVWGRIGGEQHD